MKAINGWIGSTWALGGFLMFIGGLFWLVAALFEDVVKALFGGIPIPDDMFDIVVILTLIFWGYFCMAWGSAMLKRQEWGAFVAGLVRLMLIVYLAVLALWFLFEPSFGDVILWNEGWRSFYERWYWLIWSLYGLELFWLITTTGLLFSPARRHFYAQTYQDYPSPLYPTCKTCGIILNKEGKCHDCDRPRRLAYLRIGDRQEQLEFIHSPEGAVKIIGRHQNNPEADITISKKDTEHVEHISSRHAVIRYHFDHQQFTIQDTSSTKTDLNGEQLPPQEPRLLESGDVIALADQIEITFESA